MNNELENKSNYDLCYIIRYTDKKNEAWEQLLKQSPSNSDLCYIIEYTDKKNEAGERLLKQSPSNDDLLYIVKYTDKKNEAAKELRSRFGAPEIIDEHNHIKAIAEAVLSQPGSLCMDRWHCETTHCLAGWECVLSEEARKIETQSDTETAGCAMLPSYAHLFFSDNETVLEELKKVQP